MGIILPFNFKAEYDNISSLKQSCINNPYIPRIPLFFNFSYATLFGFLGFCFNFNANWYLLKAFLE
jgi:hypothetical protein